MRFEPQTLDTTKDVITTGLSLVPSPRFDNITIKSVPKWNDSHYTQEKSPSLEGSCHV